MSIAPAPVAATSTENPSKRSAAPKRSVMYGSSSTTKMRAEPAARELSLFTPTVSQIGRCRRQQTTRRPAWRASGPHLDSPPKASGGLGEALQRPPGDQDECFGHDRRGHLGRALDTIHETDGHLDHAPPVLEDL